MFFQIERNDLLAIALQCPVSESTRNKHCTRLLMKNIILQILDSVQDHNVGRNNISREKRNGDKNVILTRE